MITDSHFKIHVPVNLWAYFIGAASRLCSTNATRYVIHVTDNIID